MWYYSWVCKHPYLYAPLTADERVTRETGLRSPSALTVRRCQLLLASAEGQPTTMMARHLRGTDQTVRHTIHAFHQRGLAVFQPQSSRPHTTAASFDAGSARPSGRCCTSVHGRSASRPASGRSHWPPR